MNYWYRTVATQTVATVFQTIIDYGDRTETVDVSTKSLPANATYQDYGWFGQNENVFSPYAGVINTQLENLGVPSTLLGAIGDYAGSEVHEPSTTVLAGM